MNKLGDRNTTKSSEDVEECRRCQGSGEIGVDIRGRFERAGPVPDDAKGFAIATCPTCKGTGYVETDDRHE